jgi:hypothetical protein
VRFLESDDVQTRDILACQQKLKFGTTYQRYRNEFVRVTARSLIVLGLIVGFSTVHVFAQTPQTSSPLPVAGATQDRPPQASPSAPGSISGTVIDKDGLVIPNAKVELKSGSLSSESPATGDGSFLFVNVPPGPFELSISAPGFENQTKAGTLQPGESYVTPQVQMVVGTTVEVNVTQTREEIAEQQVHVEEEQRLFKVVPNYYVTYLPDASPLTAKQKFQLGWKFTVDPISFVITGVIAGAEQANNSFPGYGQGAQGYGKRYGAAYADFVSGTFFGNMIFPALFKQDPRYFYKGTGSKKARLLYALANAVICKGDNGHWQPNYSSVLGSLAAGGVSNLYYPASNRNGVGLTFTNTAIGLAGSAGSAVAQEFFFRKVTSHSHEQTP